MNRLLTPNDKQKQAVMHKDGPMLVIAGPGTGKTEVIAQRIAYLLRHYGVKPGEILAITFTNKAAQEMREGVNSKIGEPHFSNLKVCTFHSFCVGLLREHASEIELSENFTIFDQDVQDELLTEAVREGNLSADDYPNWLLRNIISDAKGKLQAPTGRDIEHSLKRQVTITARANAGRTDNSKRKENIISTLQVYRDKLTAHNALDFDDIIVNTVNLLEQVPSVRKTYHETLRYILVDEYHDVNKAQYHLLQLLCPPPTGNLMVVADEEQAIYSWRGANPQYVESFKTSFNPEIVELDEHYRCSKKILRTAEKVIAKNEGRENRNTLKTHTETGQNIFHYTFRDAKDEARGIIQVIRKLIMLEKYSYRDIAVLYRTHRIADVLEEQLQQEKIEYQRIQAKNTFQKENSKAILSYLSLVQSQTPADLERAINFPEKRIDDLTHLRLKWVAKRKNIGPVEFLENISDYQKDIGPLTRKNISQFWWDITELKTYAHSKAAGNLIKIVDKLFDIVELARSPYHKEELEVIEKDADVPNLLAGNDVLYSAINSGERIQITANYGIDEYCAAHILRQTLETYLNRPVNTQFLPGGNGRPRLAKQGVHLLIGDFCELEAAETTSRVLLIGTVDTDFLDKPANEATQDTHFLQLESASQIRSITVLKLCQRLVGRFESPNLSDMVIYDLETTGTDPKKANIVELAAMRLSAIGDEIEKLHDKVKPPGGYIPKSSTRIHGIDEQAVKNSPSIEMVLPKFRKLIQDRILIGHNVAEFDNQILDRKMEKYLTQRLHNLHYDTLKTAQRLYPRQRCSLEALAERFGIESKRFHNALEDVETNRKILKKLIEADSQKREVKSLMEFLPFVAVGILSKAHAQNNPTIKALLNAAKRFVRIHQEQKDWAELIPWKSPEQERVTTFIEELSEAEMVQNDEDEVWQNLRTQFKNAVTNFEKLCLKPISPNARGSEAQLINFLDYLKLMTSSDEIDENREQLTLMTLHAAKGTEFPVVIILGMEEGSFPMWKKDITPKEIEEERRLFYVGMTRAKERLYFTSTVYRFNVRERNASIFIREIPSNYIQRWYSKMLPS